MKFDFSKIENEFDFKKEIIHLEKTDFKSLILKSFKKTSLFVSGLSVVSLFLLTNDISFQQQVDFIKQPKFNTSLLIFYSLYLMTIIIMGTVSTARDGEKLEQKFGSVWLPIKMAMFSSILIPINADHSSIFSQTLIEVIKTLDKFF